MKRWKRWAFLLAMSGPMATTYSCGSMLAQELRDAVIGAASGFVGAATSDALDTWFGANQ